MADVTLPGCEVEIPVYKLSYTFKIRNFDKLLETELGSKGIFSPDFAHPDNPEVKWRIQIFAQELDTDHVPVYIHLLCVDAGTTPDYAKISLRCSSKTWDRKVSLADGIVGISGQVPRGEVEYSEPGAFEVTAGVEYVGARPKAFAAPSLPQPQPKAPDHSSLLFSRDFSDFALVVEGRLRLHRPPGRRRRGRRGRGRDGEAGEGNAGGNVDEEGGDDKEDKGAGDKSSAHKQETSELIEVLGLAGRYDVAGLGEAAEAELRGRVDEDSLLHIAAAADLHGFPRLFKLCRDAVLSGRLALSGVEELVRDQPALAYKLIAPTHLLP